jgi:hypothetical protein
VLRTTPSIYNNVTYGVRSNYGNSISIDTAQLIAPSGISGTAPLEPL